VHHWSMCTASHRHIAMVIKMAGNLHFLVIVNSTMLWSI
jgi:hypothetical protein